MIGASAIDHDGALLDFDFREVKVAQAIIANARHVILVSDPTKFERTAPVRIGHLSQVNTFITDRCDIPSIRQICAEAEVRTDRDASARLRRCTVSHARVIFRLTFVLISH